MEQGHMVKIDETLKFNVVTGYTIKFVIISSTQITECSWDLRNDRTQRRLLDRAVSWDA